MSEGFEMNHLRKTCMSRSLKLGGFVYYEDFYLNHVRKKWDAMNHHCQLFAIELYYCRY